MEGLRWYTDDQVDGVFQKVHEATWVNENEFNPPPVARYTLVLACANETQWANERKRALRAAHDQE